MDEADRIIDKLVLEYTTKYCEVSVPPESDRYPVYAYRVRRCLDFHCTKARESGINDLFHVIESLKGHRLFNGKALRSVDSDVLGDVTLAQAYVEGDARAVGEFDLRYTNRINSLCERFVLPDGRRYLDEFYAHEFLSTCRPKSLPRLDGYIGETSLWIWMSKCIRLDFFSWAKRALRSGLRRANDFPIGEHGSADDEPSEHVRRHEMEALGADEARAAIERLFSGVINLLTPLEKQILAVEVNGGFRAEIAKIFGMHPGTVSRKARPFLERLPQMICEQIEQEKSEWVRSYLVDAVRKRPDIRKLFVEYACEPLPMLDLKPASEDQP